MQKIYKQYGEALREVGLAESDLAKKRSALNEIRSELRRNLTDGDGSIGLELSAHAFSNIGNRLQKLAMENPTIYSDVFNQENPPMSIIWPSNLEAFIITIMAEALDKSAVVQKPSKNTRDGKEYHYTIQIDKWSGPDSSLVFTGVVEGGTIKTGFFNWV